MRVGRLAVVLAATIVIAACSGVGAGGAGSAGASGTSSLTVFAAASLKSALADVESAWEANHPDSTLTVSTDSSAALATQIEQGAPADVFLSADTTNAQKLVDAGFAAGEVVPFAGNLLTVIVPKSNPARIRTPINLARDGVKVIAAGDEVPITKYATRVIENLVGEPGYPSDFVERYLENVVSREDNVAAVVSKIALGEGDAAIVYATDARGSGDVTSIPVPERANVPATYCGVVVRDAKATDAAGAFLAWLTGPEGQAILARFGFGPPA